MKIVTAFFARNWKYNQLLTVFKNSSRFYMPNIKVKILKMRKPPNIDHKRDTAFAFFGAAQYAYRHKEGILAIADCDLMFQRSIEDIKDYNFDIAITTREKIPYNSGLWFMRPTKKAKAFIKRWMKNTEYIVNNFCKFEEESHNHGGIDQASLAWTIDQMNNVDVLKLPCQEWNSTQSEWKNIDDDTRVIHIKSGLRKFCCDPRKTPDEKYNYLLPVIKKWRGFLKNDNTR